MIKFIAPVEEGVWIINECLVGSVGSGTQLDTEVVPGLQDVTANGIS